MTVCGLSHWPLYYASVDSGTRHGTLDAASTGQCKRQWRTFSSYSTPRASINATMAVSGGTSGRRYLSRDHRDYSAVRGHTAQG